MWGWFWKKDLDFVILKVFSHLSDSMITVNTQITTYSQLFYHQLGKEDKMVLGVPEQAISVAQ